MFGRTGAMWVVAASAFWLSACGRVQESEKSSPPKKSLPSQKSSPPDKSSPSKKNAEPPAGVRQITLHVPGMIDRQGIT